MAKLIFWDLENGEIRVEDTNIDDDYNNFEEYDDDYDVDEGFETIYKAEERDCPVSILFDNIGMPNSLPYLIDLKFEREHFTTRIW